MSDYEISPWVLAFIVVLAIGICMLIPLIHSDATNQLSKGGKFYLHHISGIQEEYFNAEIQNLDNGKAKFCLIPKVDLRINDDVVQESRATLFKNQVKTRTVEPSDMEVETEGGKIKKMCINLDKNIEDKARFGEHSAEAWWTNENYVLTDEFGTVISETQIMNEDVFYKNLKPNRNRLAGDNQLLYTLKIQSYADYDALISNIYAKSMRNGLPINRNLHILRHDYSEVEDVFYNTTCSEIGYLNCTNYVGGTYNKTILTTTELSPADFSIGDDVEVGIYGDVLDGDYYDIIWDYGGVSTESFMATISEDFSTGLIFAVEMEQQSGNETDELGYHNFTDVGGVLNASGVVGYARDFVPNDYFYTPDDVRLDELYNVTIEIAYYNDDITQADKGLFSTGTGAGDIMQISTVNGLCPKFHLTSLVGNYQVTVPVAGCRQDEWTHVVGRYDGTNLQVFINGQLNQTDTGSSGKFKGSNTARWIGKDVGTGYFNGKIDFVRVWNASLSDANILTLYNSGSYLSYSAVAGDTTPPTFTTIPANDSINVFTDWSGVYFVATDETEFDTFSINDTQFTINSTGFLDDTGQLSAGDYAINVTINDTSSNHNWTIYHLQVNKSADDCGVLFNETTVNYTKSFKVYSNCTSTATIYRNWTAVTNNSEQILGADTYNFTVIRADQTNYTNFYEEKSFIVNKAVSISELYIDGGHANKEIDIINTALLEGFLDFGQFGSLNLTIDGEEVNYSESTNLTYTFDPSGLGVFKVELNYSGNANFTSDYETYNITVVHVGDPIVTIVYPVSMVYYPLSTINLNYTVDEPVQDSCWYSTDGGATNSTSVTSGENFTGVSTTDGEDTFTVYCNDTAGNVGYDSVSFYIDTTPPYFTTIPSDDSITYGTNWAGVTFISADDGVGVDTYYINDTLFTITDAGFLDEVATLTAGVYTINVTVNDTFGFENSSIYVLTVNKGTGNVTTSIDGVRANATKDIYSNILINSTLVSGSGNISLYINGTLNYTGSSPYGVYYNLTEPRVYEITTAYFGNENYTAYNETWNITSADISPPVLTVSNYLYPIDTAFSETATAVENYGLDVFTLNDTSVFTVNATSGEITNVTKLNETGIYILNLSVNDTSGNTDSEVFTITIRTEIVAPNVTINTPTVATYSNATVYVNITMSESGNCTYSIDAGVTNNSLFTDDNLTFYGVTSSLSDALYTLYAYCTDDAGNVNNSVFTYFTVDAVVDAGGGGGGGAVDEEEDEEIKEIKTLLEALDVENFGDLNASLQEYIDGKIDESLGTDSEIFWRYLKNVVQRFWLFLLLGVFIYLGVFAERKRRRRLKSEKS